MASEGLTETEEELIIDLMKKLGKEWAPEFYRAISPRFALTAVEGVFLKIIQGVPNVLLHTRTDDVWRGWSAIPGSILRASDQPTKLFNGLGDAISRIQGELGGIKFKISPKPVDTFFHQNRRGPENSVIFVCELDKETTPKGFWWQSVNSLPQNLIPHHAAVIKIAAANFNCTKTAFV